MSDVKPGYTRISSIASAYAGYGGIAQHVLDRAAARGTCVHRLIEDDMNNIVISDERWSFMGDTLKGYFSSWEQFYEPYNKAEIVLQEQRIDDEATMLTGEPDLIIEHQGKIKLFDWKCSYAVGKHWRLQGSGYHYLANTAKIRVDEIYFVKLDKNGKPPIVTQYVPSWEEFFSAFDLYKEYLKDVKCNLEDE
jgi:hypothetical protein